MLKQLFSALGENEDSLPPSRVQMLEIFRDSPSGVS